MFAWYGARGGVTNSAQPPQGLVAAWVSLSCLDPCTSPIMRMARNTVTCDDPTCVAILRTFRAAGLTQMACAFATTSCALGDMSMTFAGRPVIDAVKKLAWDRWHETVRAGAADAENALAKCMSVVMRIRCVLGPWALEEILMHLYDVV